MAFLDQDDEYLPNHCETLSSILESGQFSFVWGDAAIAKPVQGADRGKGIRNKAHFGFPPTISLVLARGAASLPGALMIDKSKFSTNQIFLPELRGFEDDDLVLRLLASKQQGKFTTHVVLRWNQSPSSQSYTLRFALSRLIYWRLVREGIIWKQVGRMAKIIATLRFDYSHANDLKFFLENKNLVHDTDFHSRILCQESTPAGFFISRGVLSPRPLAHRLTLKFLKVANAFLGRLLPESSERKPRLQR